MNEERARDLAWIGSTYDDLKVLPRPVAARVRHRASRGTVETGAQARETAQGLWRYRRLEVIDDFDGDTFRAVYTVRLRHAVYVLHVFQKMSKRGSELPKADRALIEARLRRAEQVDRAGRMR